MSYWENKVAVVTGGSRGLGLAIAEVLVAAGAKVVVAARDPDVLARSVTELRGHGGDVLGIPTDITSDDQVEGMIQAAVARHGQLDLLVNCAGRSARGAINEVTVEQFRELWELNFLGLVRCTQTALPHLMARRGHVVHIGSLSSKTASPLMGGYPASKFPLAAYAQQMRLELGPSGLHVLLVCPGPLDRPDAGERYAAETGGLPPAADRPGGGAKLATIDCRWLAAKIMKACQKRKAELIVPASARWLFALAQLSPRLGDWIVRKKTE